MASHPTIFNYTEIAFHVQLYIYKWNVAVGHQVSLERAIHGRALSLVLRFVLLLLRMSEIRRCHSFHLLHKKKQVSSFYIFTCP